MAVSPFYTNTKLGSSDVLGDPGLVMPSLIELDSRIVLLNKLTQELSRGNQVLVGTMIYTPLPNGQMYRIMTSGSNFQSYEIVDDSIIIIAGRSRFSFGELTSRQKVDIIDRDNLLEVDITYCKVAEYDYTNRFFFSVINP